MSNSLKNIGPRRPQSSKIQSKKHKAELIRRGLIEAPKKK